MADYLRFDPELVERARTEDPVALDELLSLLRPHLVRYAWNRLGRYGSGREMAEDVAQETLIGVTASLPAYVRSDVPFGAWVWRIAANKVADQHRKVHRSQESPYQPAFEIDGASEYAARLVDDGPSVESIAITRDELRRALATVDRLLPRRDAVLIRMRAEGYSAAEAGQAVRMKANAVRVAQHRALALLKSLL